MIADEDARATAENADFDGPDGPGFAQLRRGKRRGSDVMAAVDKNAVNTARAVTILELRADEVIEVARAARHIRKLHELRDHTVEVQETQLHTQTAIRRLGDLCCDPRLIVALMLYAADHPDWAWVNFWAAFCPDITVRQMAGLRKIPVSTVRTHLANVTLPDDAYNFIPDDR